MSVDMLEKLACLFGITVNDIENSNIDASGLTVTFRPSDLSIEDLEAISAVNRIALNPEYMAELLKGQHV